VYGVTGALVISFSLSGIPWVGYALDEEVRTADQPPP